MRGRAIEAAEGAAQDLGLRVVPTRGDASRFGVTLSSGDGSSLTLYLERVREGNRYYRQAGALGLWYPGGNGSAAPAWASGALDSMASLLLSPPFAGIADELSPQLRQPGNDTEGTAADRADESATAPYPPAIPTQRPSDRAVAAPGDEDLSYARDYVLGADDVEKFFHVDYEYDADADVEQPPTCRIGIIYQCNQTCTFCQLAEMNTHIPPERVFAALDASRRRGATRVIITGGEPTMCRDLVAYIEYAREHGFTTIEMQTNATLLDKSERAARLHTAGLTDAQVSLHGPDSDISDRLTAAPGTHRRTLAGIGNLLDAGVRVLLNHLVFRDNSHLLLDYVDMVERRWGRHRERLILQFHTPLNEFARIEHARRHIARYTDYAPLLLRAIDKARSLGYRVQDLGDPTGIPALCVLGADSEYLGPILSQRSKPRLHRWESQWVARVAACDSCDLTEACMGVPKSYLAVHGDDEFHPIVLSKS